ncbi:MAG TPA: PIN domain-containing protein [Thermoguttaceae bacterium]
MNDYLGQLIQRYSRQGIIVDTNILLLYFVGNLNRLYIAKHKRTRQYLAEDFDLLTNFLRFFQNRIVTTPNILTEVSNLLGDSITPEQKRLWNIFVAAIGIMEEKYLPSQTLCQKPMLSRFGLTDSAIDELVREKYLVLTDDAMLFQHLEKNGLDVVNFTHLRAPRLLTS